MPLQLLLNEQPQTWEVIWMDTLDYWKFGDYKNYTSLRLLTAVFRIHRQGSLTAVGGTCVYKENNLPRIAAYCQKDVLATAQSGSSKQTRNN